MRYTTKGLHPSRGTIGSAGLDLAINQDIQLPPHHEYSKYAISLPVADTGIAVEIPIGCVGLIFERSSTAQKHRLGLANKVGVVDSDYRGTIKLPLINYLDYPRTIEAGIYIAQLVVVPIVMVRPVEVAQLEPTMRGDKGFGSTNR